MSTKAGLKAAKAAIDSKKWDEAITQAEAVLEKDSKNYFAWVTANIHQPSCHSSRFPRKLFLGRALHKIGKPEEAAKAYEDATKIRPAEDQAWLGMRSVYESQGAAKVDKYTSVGLKLAEIYMEA